ncbi:alpha/beta hydrolase [Caulobacter segnis]|uniref:alpha/beta fold hydrolase n=1 Tax=Caulobacter segnis TaxID=88688 RepID=UPI00285ABF31|nr:alpha/beta hydrolase [Caulobacter segnis]MDR6626875.1 pimeloyl-ACP methyl ester carboxylesterase [Caulobacter segnis]
MIRRRILASAASGLAVLALGGLAGCGAERNDIRDRSAAPPPTLAQGYFERDGARLWYGAVGEGPPVILLHGGLSSHKAWSGQVPALVQAGYQVILFDSRGHGRSTLGTAPLTYERMAADVGALIARLRLEQPAIVGWSDGAIVALVLAMDPAAELGPIYAFGANMNQEGVRANAGNAPILKQVGPRLAADYAELSPAPDFAALSQAVRTMQSSSLNLPAHQVARVRSTAVKIATGDSDEFILPTHAVWIARTIPGAELEVLSGCGHFAPWEAPATFNRSILAFLEARGRR